MTGQQRSQVRVSTTIAVILGANIALRSNAAAGIAAGLICLTLMIYWKFYRR